MIIRFKKGGSVDVVRKDGKVDVEEKKDTPLSNSSLSGTIPIRIMPDLNYQPERIFWCQRCQTFTDARLRNTNHAGHKGSEFKASSQWFDDRVAAIVENGRVVWIRKEEAQQPTNSAV